MSLGYAERLSYKEDVGKVGMPELFDGEQDASRKMAELAQMIRESRHLVVFTGAGISTSCGIPDFRGPNGIWTLQHQGKPIPKAGLPFYQATPGLTHMALSRLCTAGILKFCISQNVDCLHLRSGIPRELLAELHGNCFREVCASCKREYVRDFELETIGLKPTGRRCEADKCRGKLVDTILDWEDALPPDELKRSEDECKAADLILCLGTSLQITPACNLPMRTVRSGGKMVIVNLQETPKDKKAALVIRAKVDEVMRHVMSALDMRIPSYVRTDHFVVCESRRPTDGGKIRWALTVASRHSRKAPLPFLRAAEFSFPEDPEMGAEEISKPPFTIRRSTPDSKPCRVSLRLTLDDGLTGPTTSLFHIVTPEEEEDEDVAAASEREHPPALQAGRSVARESATKGQVFLLSTTENKAERTTTFEYGLVTSITPFDEQQGNPPKNEETERGRDCNVANGGTVAGGRGDERSEALVPCQRVDAETKIANGRDHPNMSRGTLPVAPRQGAGDEGMGSGKNVSRALQKRKRF